MSDPLYPWQLTLAELLERVRSFYGEEQGATAARTIEALAERIGLDRDELLEPEILRFLLRRAGLPVEDHGLDGE